MNFHEYVADNELAMVAAFLGRVGQMVLASAREVAGVVSFKFPDYEALMAASNKPLGSLVREGVEKEGGKGKLAYNAGVDAGFIKPFRSSQDALRFQRTLDNKLRYISKDMGLLFETEIFLNLVVSRKLAPVGQRTLSHVKEIRQEYLENIKRRITNGLIFGRIVALVRNHAIDLANQMYARAVRVVQQKCNGQITQVQFMGGQDQGFAGVADTADIRIGCDLEKVGFATKFTSEAKIAYRGLSAQTAYTMLGGDKPERFDEQVKKVMLRGDQETKRFLIDTYYELAMRNFDDPDGFVQLLNHILTGGSHTFPAARNYTRNAGGAEWSMAIQRDFNVSDDPVSPLRAKEGAQVSVSASAVYVKLLYKVAGGSRDGTFVLLEPDIKMAELFGDMDDFAPEAVKRARIIVKVNNIATDRFNNNQPGRLKR